MKTIFPKKLNKGDKVRVVAPARSLNIISDDSRDIANKRFADMGFELSFGKYVDEVHCFDSASVEHRVHDLHEAFADRSISAVITVIGGFNSNQLLKHLDWQLIASNPKIFCGFSDITILNNAIYKKTGLVNYYGPHYSSFGQKLHFEYTLDYFRRCLMSEDSYSVDSSQFWSDDRWYAEQNRRSMINNAGMFPINNGEAKGVALGGNLCTFNLLQGSEYFPDLTGSILFVEDAELTGAYSDTVFDRNLQSLLCLPDFDKVRGIVIGRFQKASHMSISKLTTIVRNKPELDNIPVIADADFGHTDPKFTWPIGGDISISVADNDISIKVMRH